MLECSEKPRFACGQLLTDEDLTALVKWSETKSALARFRHGWGVVCGLDVYASSQDGQVNVGPGYALDGCGRDIVVCSETTISLDACCKPELPPCKDLVASPAPTVSAEFGGIKSHDLRVVDMVLHYAEIDGSPRTALGGVTCATGSRHEYSRTQESSRIECVPGTADGDPLRLQAEKWEEGYRACLHVLKCYRDESDNAKGAEVHHWLSRWLERHPLRHFGFVKDWVSHKPAGDWDEPQAVQALFWIVQDCRNSYINSSCSHHQGADGVPIARLWLRLPSTSSTKTKCQVIAIDTQPPHRRFMRSDSQPAPLQSVNLARVIWRRVEEAQSMLVGLGMETRDPDLFELPQSVKALEAKLEAGKVIVAIDSVAKLQFVDAGSLGYRVIGVVG